MRASTILAALGVLALSHAVEGGGPSPTVKVPSRTMALEKRANPFGHGFPTPTEALKGSLWGTPYPPLTHPETHSEANTTTVASISGKVVPITQSTQMIDGQVWVVDPLIKYQQYDRMTHPVIPTQACVKGNSDYQHKSCQIDRCMWQHLAPMNIQTAVYAEVIDPAHGTSTVVMTFKTGLYDPHYGTVAENGVYYPKTHVNINGIRTVTRHFPESDRHSGISATSPAMRPSRPKEWHHGKPICWDGASCLRRCHEEVDNDDRRNFAFKLAVPFSLTILAIIAIALCLRRSHDRRRRRQQEEGQRGRSSSPVPQSTVVEEVVAGSAAGSALASEKENNQAADDGRGTTGRRAEEGRGQVNFAEPGETSPHEATTVVPSEQQSHVETVPANDGAGGLPTGRQVTDQGSMRGRKKSRPDGGLGLSLRL